MTLAALTVRAGQLEAHSDGVSYDPEKGLVTFPNPRSLAFVPAVSDTATKGGPDNYITTTHFIRDIGRSNQFTVWSKSLDTESRNYPPSDFTAVVAGF